MNLFARLYALLLHLYPHGFRQEFAEEMQDVFAQVLQDCAGRGRTSSARAVLHEIADLPGSLLGQLFAADGSRDLDNQAGELEAPRPGTWIDAGFSAVPHLLFALAFYLPLLVTVGLDLPDYRGPSLPVFWGLTAAVLVVSKGRGWPRWSASWIGYGLVFLLVQSSVYFPDGLWASLAGLVWLVMGAGVLIWLARRDWIASLLAVLPVSPMWVWLARLDGLPAHLEPAALYLSLSLVIAGAVIAIVRLGRWQSALLLLLLVILVSGLPGSSGALRPGVADWGEAGGWLAGYAGILFLTAPSWLMALWRHARRR